MQMNITQGGIAIEGKNTEPKEGAEYELSGLIYQKFNFISLNILYELFFPLFTILNSILKKV